MNKMYLSRKNYSVHDIFEIRQFHNENYVKNINYRLPEQ